MTGWLQGMCGTGLCWIAARCSLTAFYGCSSFDHTQFARATGGGAPIRRDRSRLPEMSHYCIDTVAYSHFKRGEERIADILDRASWIGIPVIVIGELCAGFPQGNRYQTNVAEPDEFLPLRVVGVLQVDRQIAEIFGEIVADLKRRGRPIPVNDIWIAATCARHDATLLTWDAHFREIPRIGSLIPGSDRH